MIALCSAFKKGLIGLQINNIKDYSELDANCGHSEKMLPAIDDLLMKNSLSLSDNDCFAVVVGPGSFTGLRISLGLVKGFNCGKKQFNVIEITSFEFMAYTYIKSFSPKENFWCAINALSGNVFVAEFDKEGKQLSKERLEKIEFIKPLKNVVSLKEENLSDTQIELNAKDLLEIANLKNDKKNYVSVNEIQPLYLRKSQAEDELEKKEKNIKNN